MVATIALALIGFILLIMGIIIWRFKLTDLIVGYAPEIVNDPVGLANWVGKCVLYTGLSALFIATINYLYPARHSGLLAVIVFMIICMVSIVIALAGSQKFFKR